MFFNWCIVAVQHYINCKCAIWWCCSVAKSCPTLWDPMNCSRPGFPVLHHLPKLAQTHVHWVSDAIQPSCLCCPLLLLPSIFPASGSFPVSWLFASGGQSIGASVSVLPVNIQGWFPLGLTGTIKWFTIFKGYTPCIVIMKHWPYSPMLYMYPCSLIYTEKFVPLIPLSMYCPCPYCICLYLSDLFHLA